MLQYIWMTILITGLLKTQCYLWFVFSYLTNYATVNLIESILMFSQVATFDLLYALVKADKDTIRPMYFTFSSD